MNVQEEYKRKLTPGVESARRAFQILFMFNEDKPELSVEDIAQQHSISLPSAYRYISLLREMHLVNTGPHGGIILTPRVMELAAAAEKSLDLESMVRPVLERLMSATGETCFLLRRHRKEAMFVMAAEPDRALALSFRSGNAMPLTRGAVAKVLLAFAPSGFRQNYLSQSITSPKERTELAKELDTICENDMAESEGEVDDGIWGCAVPVRIGGMVIASLSIAGPGFRLSEEMRDEIRKLLREATVELTERSTVD